MRKTFIPIASVFLIFTTTVFASPSVDFKSNLISKCEVSLNKNHSAIGAENIKNFCKCPVIWMGGLYVRRSRPENAAIIQDLLVGDYLQVAKDSLAAPEPMIYAHAQLKVCLEKYAK